MTVSNVSAKGIQVKINDSLMGFIPTQHLSDHITLCDALLNRFKVGDTVDNAMVLKKKEKSRRIVSKYFHFLFLSRFIEETLMFKRFRS